jgi:hypothetical protein
VMNETLSMSEERKEKKEGKCKEASGKERALKIGKRS